MIALIQRVSSASVQIDGKIKASIHRGLLVFLGISCGDDGKAAGMLARKTAALRIFEDNEAKMNLSVTDISAEALVISQFTLCADTRKGNRPSFINAAQPDKAATLYEEFVLQLQSAIGSERVKTGEFGADMKVELINDGPVTIILDTESKKS